MPAPLDGVTVLDLSQVVSGPICGRLLADLGADVVKVEPAEGDVIRNAPPAGRRRPGQRVLHLGQRGQAFRRRSTCAHPEGADLVRQLAVTSDVVLENFRPGVLDKFGLDADSLLAPHPRLDLLLDQRMGSRQLVVAATRVRGDGAGRGRPGRARCPPAERAARAEPTRRRRHHPRSARGERDPRRALPTRPHRTRTAPRRLDGRGARVHRRVDLDRARRLRRSADSRHVELSRVHPRRRDGGGVHGRSAPPPARDRGRAHR